jgi:hypothetical protein
MWTGKFASGYGPVAASYEDSNDHYSHDPKLAHPYHKPVAVSYEAYILFSWSSDGTTYQHVHPHHKPVAVI